MHLPSPRLLAVGLAGLACLSASPAAPLTAGGTFLAALVVYERVTGRDPRTLPTQAFAGGRAFSLPGATIRALQSAAHDANTRYPAGAVPTDEELSRPSRYHSGRASC